MTSLDRTLLLILLSGMVLSCQRDLWTKWRGASLDGWVLSRDDDGTPVLVDCVRDPVTLHGFVCRVRDLDLTGCGGSCAAGSERLRFPAENGTIESNLMGEGGQ